MGGLLNFKKLMARAIANGPGQQYTFDPAAQRYNPKEGGGSGMGSKVSFDPAEQKYSSEGMKKGGKVKSSASKRADGCAQRGKTRA
jgi:hypothetical protein